MFGAPYLKKMASDIGNKLNKSNEHFKFPSLYLNGFRMITVLVFQVLTSLRGLSLISFILVINKQAGTLYYMTYVKPLHDISSYHESVTCLHNMLKLIDFKIKFDCNVSSISSCTEKLTLRYMHYLYSKLVFESLSFIRLINELVTHGR